MLSSGVREKFSSSSRLCMSVPTKVLSQDVVKLKLPKDIEAQGIANVKKLKRSVGWELVASSTTRSRTERRFLVCWKG